MELRVLAVGDVVGEGGLQCLEQHLRSLKKLYRIDFCVVNGENASGTGLTPKQADRMLDAGADILTLGNHSFDRREICAYLDDCPYILRPANLQPSLPGRGFGVLVPGIVRLRESGGYELVAGHRRKRACELAGLEKMPVIIKDLTDDEATVIMVDSNIQREELLISEKAFAYKMKYEALKRQGKRSDLTSCQVGKKLAAEEVSQNTGDSSRQILRYIHLTELIAELLELADEKKLPFNTAVEVSYLRSEEQQILLQYMSNHNMVPSMKQAKELKQIAKEQMLTYSEIDQICMNESTEKVQVQIPAKKLKQYFPESYSKAQMEEVIFMLLASWAEKQ